MIESTFPSLEEVQTYLYEDESILIEECEITEID